MLKDLILKRFDQSDSILFFQLVRKNYSRIAQSFPVTIKKTLDITNTEKYIGEKINAWEGKKAFCLGIWHKPSVKLIGEVAVRNIDWKHQKCELGFFISFGYEGKGLMQQAVTGVQEFVFNQLKIKKIFVRIIVTNHRSINLAHRCGFVSEGILKKDFKSQEGRFLDIHYMGISRKDFQKKENSQNNFAPF
ncbi:MAG: GNAT family N-acetyltransferase [Candidatus Cyclobacteriaceae bacterium M3_2C_046]